MTCTPKEIESKNLLRKIKYESGRLKINHLGYKFGINHQKRINPNSTCKVGVNAFLCVRTCILFTMIITLTSCNRIEYIVRKSIPLRTFILYKESITLIVRFRFKANYERLHMFMHFYERF